MKRKSDFASHLKKAGSGTGIKVDITEIDALRGGKRHDMLRKSQQRKIVAAVHRGDYEVVAASPPCSTLSRARSANTSGPRPLRSRLHP